MLEIKIDDKPGHCGAVNTSGKGTLAGARSIGENLVAPCYLRSLTQGYQPREIYEVQ